ncbi:PepSY domain-containing protein [Streptomyces sp. NPDC047860]|uniref:PepSY domain-containing protein n=1 Tax=Streptomyces sp. NPDC047860 TaxID=3155743 RepID=UPI0033DA570E
MKRNIVIAVVAAAALVGGGTATAIGVSGGEDGGSGSGSVSSPAVRAGDDDGRDDDRRDDDGRGERVSGEVTAADAIAAALKHTPGTAVSAELDDDGSWEVEVLGRGDGWRSVRVDPGSGKVLGAWADYEDDAGEVRAALKGASVSAQEAAEAAGAKGTVVSVELDDDGDPGWEAETRGSSGDERDWRVDVRSGEVSVERGDDGGDSADD